MERKANEEELRAQEYLLSLDYTDIVYEPLGNVTPDFVIDKSIAVEVRRLNRNYMKDEHLVSMENYEKIDCKPISPIDPKWLPHELQRNIQLVINEKDSKIEQNFNLYKEWWLILVDCISYGEDKKVFNYLKHISFEKHKFSRVIIIAPKSDFHAYEF